MKFRFVIKVFLFTLVFIAGQITNKMNLIFVLIFIYCLPFYEDFASADFVVVFT